MKDFEFFTLPNGIRVVHKQVEHTRLAHCGITLDIGSRDEQPGQEGIAHFLEHMVFKGTRKRKAFHILNSLDSVGGELNAFTTKEKICLHASVLEKHFDRAAEVLKDITFDSVFPSKEIDKERNVILEEMAMYEESPEESIHDDFETLIFRQHTLGGNILGTAENIKRFKKEDFTEFLAANLNTDRIVFSSVSNLSFDKVKKKIEKHFGDIKHQSVNRLRHVFNKYEPRNMVVNKNIARAHRVIGCPAYDLDSEYRLPFFMLVNLLGGPALNSRLNLSLREKSGYVYHTEANYTPFTDTGLFSVYFATEKKRVEAVTKIIYKEFKQLREKKLGSGQLRALKQQVTGLTAAAEESNAGLMLMTGKSILDLGRIESLSDVLDQINAVKADELQAVACEMLEEENMSRLTYMPDKEIDN